MSNKADRLAMLTLALQTNEQFKVNSIELNRSGPSYTIDTISRLQAKYPDAIFYFIIGGDMVESLPSWKKIDELIKRVQFVGVTRAHYSLQSVYNIIRIDIPSIDISSSYIRESIQHERSFRYLLPSDVYHYIKEHKLYGFR